MWKKSRAAEPYEWEGIMRLLERGLEHQALTQANQNTRLAGQMLEIGVNAWHPQADICRCIRQ